MVILFSLLVGVITEVFMGVYLCVCVGCYQRENIELYFIMPMDNIAHCAHYGI